MLKLLGYYGFCSVKNQIRKLFKTWFAIFILICFALGVTIGIIAAKIDESAETDPAAAVEAEGDLPSEDIAGQLFGDLEKQSVLELAVGAFILMLFLFNLLTAGEKGYCIFLPADVSTLFVSPLSPQMVLMFRVLCQMGLYIFFTIYFMIEIPALKDMLDLTGFGAASVILCFGFSLMLSVFSRIYLSLFNSAHKKFAQLWPYFLYGLLAVIAAIFLSFWKSGSLGPIEAAAAFFNSKPFLYVPVLGWLKGIVVFASRGNITGFCVCALLSIGAAIAFLYMIKSIKVDFYEEAIKKADEVAEATAKMQEKGKLFVKTKNEKQTEKQEEKQEKLVRNNLNHGFGASVILAKSLYNRSRFAIGGALTKTMITYLFVSVIAALLARGSELGMFIPSVIIAAFVFFRSMGNPLREDTDNLYFMMAPEKSWLKLFYSVLAGCVNCFLDVLPGIVISGILLKADPLEILGWTCFIVTMDFFSTCAGAFVNLSLPQNAGATVKQIMQISFLYIGMVPDALIIVLGLTNGGSVGSVILMASLVNLIVGLAFFSLTVSFVQPRGGIQRFAGDPGMDTGLARRSFSAAGFSALTVYALTIIIQLAVLAICRASNPDFAPEGVWIYLLSFLPMYCAGMPVALLVLKGNRRKAPDRHPIALGRYVKFIPVMSLFMLAGSLVGTLCSLLCSSLAGNEYVNPVVTILDGQNLAVQILFVVIIGPLAEELFFRKVLIDSLNAYGERIAIVASAVLFGLFHGNLSQIPYTALLGLLLGYVYERSGNVLYSWGLHMMLNFFNGIVPTYILSGIDLDALDALESVADIINENSASLTALGIYYIVFLALAVAGLVIFLCEHRNLRFERAPEELPDGKRFSTAFVNPGSICFIIFTIALIIDGYTGFLPW